LTKCTEVKSDGASRVKPSRPRACNSAERKRLLHVAAEPNAARSALSLAVMRKMSPRCYSRRHSWRR
jgi:hypothetical protein